MQLSQFFFSRIIPSVVLSLVLLPGSILAAQAPEGLFGARTAVQSDTREIIRVFQRYGDIVSVVSLDVVIEEGGKYRISGKQVEPQTGKLSAEEIAQLTRRIRDMEDTRCATGFLSSATGSTRYWLRSADEIVEVYRYGCDRLEEVDPLFLKVLGLNTDAR